MYYKIFKRHPQTARICLGPSPEKTECDDYSFANTLRSILKNFILIDIKLPYKFERVAALEFAEKVNMKAKWILHIEILGAKSNVILTSSFDNKIQALAYQTPSSNNRIVQTSVEYNPPVVSKTTINPIVFLDSESVYNYETFEKLLFQKNTSKLEDAMLSCFIGLSRGIVEEISRLSFIDRNLTVQYLNQTELKLVYENFLLWVKILSDSNSHNPSLHLNVEDGIPVNYTIQLSNIIEDKEAFQINRCINKYYNYNEKDMLFNSIKTSCLKELYNRKSKIENLRKLFMSKIDETRYIL